MFWIEISFPLRTVTPVQQNAPFLTCLKNTSQWAWIREEDGEGMIIKAKTGVSPWLLWETLFLLLIKIHPIFQATSYHHSLYSSVTLLHACHVWSNSLTSTGFSKPCVIIYQHWVFTVYHLTAGSNMPNGVLVIFCIICAACVNASHKWPPAFFWVWINSFPYTKVM